MSLIRVAIPIVLGLTLLELAWGLVRRRRVHGLADSVTDFGCGAMSQVIGLGVTAVTVGGYAATSAALAPYRSEIDATAAAWVVVFLVVDLGHYALHRLSHRVNVLWACHAVHHSSEEFNYVVGLRNSSFHGFLIWVFFLPAAIAGVPWRMVAVCYGVNVLYQFWLHTRLIGRLGPLEALLNTPSHHRVHHGTDDHYVDRNFAGVLIIWDRLFGTFVPEGAEPRYGVVVPLESWNPVWANFQGFALIGAAWRRAPDWRGRVRAIFGPPESLGQAAQSGPPSHPSRGVAVYTAAHFILSVAVVLGVVHPSATPTLLRIGGAGFVLATLGILGGLLDGRAWALRWEWARVASIVGMAVALPAEPALRIGLATVAAASAMWLTRERTAGARASHPTRFPI